MSRHLPFLTIFIFWLCLCGRAEAQKSSTPEGRLFQDLQFLTSAACEGRGITTKGIELAAQHVERQFANAGLKPGVSGSYYQPFTMALSGKTGPGNKLVLKGSLGQTLWLEPGRDFTALMLGGTGKAEAELVFAGHGITLPPHLSLSPKGKGEERAYDDYAGLDVAGKVVLVLTDYPRRDRLIAESFTGDIGFGPNEFLRAQLENARKHKAAGLLVVHSRARPLRFGDRLPRPHLSSGDGAPLGLPAAHLARDLLDAMLFSAAGQTLIQIEQKIDADLKPHSLLLPGWSCRLETDIQYDQVKVKNVIGFLEGSGPLAKETVVIGAHYDHVGYFGSTRRIGAASLAVSSPGGIGGVGFPLALTLESGIHHGADDNASGTAVLLELARHFGAIKNRSGRRLVFIAFTAEESGLVGSDYYCRQPIYPLKDTAAMINMDQVGRLQDNKLVVSGLGSAKPFLPLLDKLNEKHRFDLTRDLSGLAPSDHSSFYGRQVPVIWFFTGFHEQYHRPTDRLETVNVPGLARIVALIADVASDLTTQPDRPQFTRTPPFDRTRTLWASAPSIGIVPEYRPAEKGVVVADLIRNTPAVQSGLKKGDRILAVAGNNIPDILTFLNQTRALQSGQTVPLEVERAGQPLKINLSLPPAPVGYINPHFGFTANLDEIKNGLTVLDVLPGSTASEAGLKKGDRILAIATAPLPDRESYLTILRTLTPGEIVPLTLERAGQTLDLKIQAAGNGKKAR